MLEATPLFLPLLEFAIFFFFLSRFYIKFMKKSDILKANHSYNFNRTNLEQKVNKLQEDILNNACKMTAIFGTSYFATIFILKRNCDIDYIKSTYTDNYLIYCTLWCSLSLIVHHYFSRKLAFYIMSFAMSLYLPLYVIYM